MGAAAPPHTPPPKPVTPAQAGGRGQDLNSQTVRPVTGPGDRQDPENNKFVYVHEIAAAPGMGTAGW